MARVIDDLFKDWFGERQSKNGRYQGRLLCSEMGQKRLQGAVKVRVPL